MCAHIPTREHSFTSDSLANLNVRTTYNQIAQESLTKQLLCIVGISLEKAGAVDELYGLLRGLFQKLEGAERIEGKGEPELLTKEGQAERAESMAEGLGKGRKGRMGKELSICEDLSVVRSQIT